MMEFIIGLVIGMFVAGLIFSALSVRSYEKGYHDKGKCND